MKKASLILAALLAIGTIGITAQAGVVVVRAAPRVVYVAPRPVYIAPRPVVVVRQASPIVPLAVGVAVGAAIASRPHLAPVAADVCDTLTYQQRQAINARAYNYARANMPVCPL